MKEDKCFENKCKYISVSIFFFVIFIFFISSFFMKNGGYSEEEKRDLKQFPQISKMSAKDFFDAKYFIEIDSFYKDNFPYRDIFLDFNTNIELARGIRVNDVKITQPAVAKKSEIETDIEVEKEAVGDTDENKEASVNVEQVGGLLSIGDSVVEMFGGVESVAKEYANTISEYADILSDKKVYNIVIPTHVEFILPEKYKDLSKPQDENIDYIKSNLSNKVVAVDAYSKLKEHKDEYIYFRSDHHWTGLGAYYAYTAFAEKSGFEPIDLKDYKSNKKEGFLGTLYNASKESILKENPDYVEYYNVGADLKTTMYKNSSLNNPIDTTLYADYASGGNSYGVFLHGDNALMKIENKDSDNNKSAIVIKESYGNAFAPYLTVHYKETYILDPRYFKGNLVYFINENNIDEVIFINNILAANTQMHVNNLKKLK